MPKAANSFCVKFTLVGRMLSSSDFDTNLPAEGCSTPTHRHFQPSEWDFNISAHCNTLQYTATHCNTVVCLVTVMSLVRHAATTLLNTATPCNTLQHTATPCNTTICLVTCVSLVQRAATTNPNTATHCNTLQHTATQLCVLWHTRPTCA